MSTMRNRWQLKIIFMVLLITSCFGGPVFPPKKNVTSSNSDVPAIANKLTFDTPKLEEENLKPEEPDANKAPLSPSILNFNVKMQLTTAASNTAASNIAASNQVVSQAVSVENNASAVPVSVIPSGILPVEATEAVAGEQPKTGVNQSEAVIVDNKTTNVSDGKIIDKNEAKVIESVTTNETKVSNMTTKDETKPDGIIEEVNQEKNTNDSVISPTLPSVNAIKSTVSEDKKSNVSEPDSGSNKETEPKLEPSLDSQNNGSTLTQKQSTHSHENTLLENQDPSKGSDSNTQAGNQPPIANSESNSLPDNLENKADSVLNTQPDNQQPSLNPESDTHTENKDFSKESTSNIQDIKNIPSEADSSVQASKAATPSSFDIKYGDSAPTYPQISDSDYSSFDTYDKNGMSSSNNIIEDGLNNEDTIPYNNDRGSYENERGAYENQQQKLNGQFTSDEDSHFFAYFLTIMVTAIVFYLLFHNKQRVGQACGCVNKNERLKRIKEDRAKEPLLKSNPTEG